MREKVFRSALGDLTPSQCDILDVIYDAGHGGIGYYGIADALGKRVPYSSLGILLKKGLIKKNKEDGPLQEMTFSVTITGTKYYSQDNATVEERPPKKITDSQRIILREIYRARYKGIDFYGLVKELRVRPSQITVNTLESLGLVSADRGTGPVQNKTYYITEEGKKYFQE